MTAVTYVPGNTFVHRAHPATLLMFEIVVLVVVLQFSNPVLLAVLLVAVLVLVGSLGVSLRSQGHLVAVAIVALVFTLTQGLWFTSFGTLAGGSATVLFHVWPGWLPGGPRMAFVAQGAVYGLSLGLRFAVIAAAFPILVMTTHPGDLVAALSRARIGRRKVPDSIVFVLTTALRYVPTMSRRFQETKDAQRARGIVTDSFNPLRRMASSVSLLLPVMLSSLVKAQELTLVLEIRGFGSCEGRTCVRQVPFRRSDLFANVVLILVAFAAVMVLPSWRLAHLSFAP